MFVGALALAARGAIASDTANALVDQIEFANNTSEQAHALKADNSRVDTDKAGRSVRRLLPTDPTTWQGGRIEFEMDVDPNGPNFFTACFSGDEANENRLMLIADGKQIGWRHLGEIDQLDFGTWAPAVPGRFYYDTFPLPESVTRGKKRIRFEVRSSGRIWPYGQTFDKYQQPMTAPSRGLYRFYTTRSGFFVPPASEKQGRISANPPVASSPGPEVLDQVKQRVNKELDARINAAGPVGQTQIQLLAKAYDVKWSKAYQNPKAIEQIVRSIDALYVAYTKNPKLAEAEPSTWNPDWFGLGLCGEAIWLRQEQVRPLLDQPVTGLQISRRQAYTDMLVACRDWHRLHRRGYTNQTMLNDTNGIYLANRGVAVTEPAKALNEPKVRRYLYESVGLEPWRDSDAGGSRFGFGSDYWQLTDKGLTRELGYVGTYGEVVDLIGLMYEATKPSINEPGDEKIRQQLIKATKARAAMRYPEVDPEGNRIMRLEQIIGWRDLHYPGEMVYGQRATRDASALQAAALTLDPELLGYAQQMIDDNQFFNSELEAMNDRAQPLRTTIGRLSTPDQYELIKSQPRSQSQLPMSRGTKDYLFTDEQDGVVALKDGDDILYVSLYWRARFAINNLARVHHITPQFDRIAVVPQETQFTDSGLVYVAPNVTNAQQARNGGVKYPDYDVPSAYAAQKQPIAKVPADIPFKAGQENPYAGKGDFYTLRYGPYLIGMNMTAGKTFELKVPSAKEVYSVGGQRRSVEPGSTLSVAPRSTVVLKVVGD